MKDSFEDVAKDSGGGEVPMIDRRTLGGGALAVGGLLFFLLWFGTVTNTDFLSTEAHAVQLVFFGATIASIEGGLWITTRSQATERNRILMTTGALVAMVGLVFNFGLWAMGVAVLGAAYLLDRRYRWIGAVLLVAGSIWLVVLALGARFGSEGDVPLAGLDLALATVGLIGIAGGLSASGLTMLRRVSATPAGSSS